MIAALRFAFWAGPAALHETGLAAQALAHVPESQATAMDILLDGFAALFLGWPAPGRALPRHVSHGGPAAETLNPRTESRTAAAEVMPADRERIRLQSRSSTCSSQSVTSCSLVGK
jgi:hypothetical protein